MLLNLHKLLESSILKLISHTYLQQSKPNKKTQWNDTVYVLSNTMIINDTS